MEQLFTQFLSLAGVAAFIAALINIGKTFGFVKDGTANKVSSVLSLAAFAVFVGLKFFSPDVDFAGLDATAAQIAEFSLYVLGFLVQMGLPAKVHNFISYSEVPLIGKSYSLDYIEQFEAEG